MKLLILASGKGSRLNKLTKKKPKCLVNVLNKPIISYLTPSFDLFTQVIFVVGYPLFVIALLLVIYFQYKKIKKIENNFDL